MKKKCVYLTTDDSEFDTVLRTAKTDVSLPHTFRAEVWQRIANQDCLAVESRLIEIFFAFLVRPAIASIMVLGMISLGLWLGASGSDVTLHHEKLAYVQSVSPFATLHTEKQ